jgi:hypothetical protein
LGLLISAGALSVSCGDETSNDNGIGGSTAGTAGASAGSPMAGNNSGGANNNGGNGAAGSNAGSMNGGTDNAGGTDAAGGDGNLAGAGNPSGGDGSMAGAGNPNGGMPGGEGGAGSPGVGGGAGGAGFDECSAAADMEPCFRPGGFQNACTNDGGQLCVCQRVSQQSQDREWNCFAADPGQGGAGGADPGFTADCGQIPVTGGDCTGFGFCQGAPTCACFQDNVFCQ